MKFYAHTSNRNKLYTNSITAFKPLLISDIDTLLDAQNTSTITLNGADVSNWIDQVHERDFAQASASLQATYVQNAHLGRNVVYPATTDYVSLAASTTLYNYLNNTNGSTVIFVAYKRSGTNAAAVVFGTERGSSNDWGMICFYDNRSSVPAVEQFKVWIDRNTSPAYLSMSDNSTFTTDEMIIGTIAVDADVEANTYINNAVVQTENTFNGPPIAGSSEYDLHIMNRPTGSLGWDDYFMYIVFFKRVLSQSEREYMYNSLSKYCGVSY